MKWHFFPQKLSQRPRNSGKTAYESPIIATQPQKRPGPSRRFGVAGNSLWPIFYHP